MDFTDKNVMVIGLARSGLAALKALHKRGARLTAYDAKAAADLGGCVAELQAMDVTLYTGEYPPVDADLDLLVASPGVPLEIEPIQSALRQQIEVISELELAYRIKSEQLEMLAVTGTNGKTTTTTLLEKILLAAGRPAAAGGNIGVALCSLVEEMQDGYISVEASSFQLETASTFRPHIAAILNITPDHLDRHKTMEGYMAAKAKVFARQTKDDFLVLNYDDEQVKKMGDQAGSRVIFFSQEQSLEEGVFVAEHFIRIKWQGEIHDLMPVAELRLRGRHNLENALCATAMAWADGVSLESIAQVLRTFNGVRHRLEEVACHNDILYINDSKGTNPDSTIKALCAFDRPIVLIAGGRPKGGSYQQVTREISQRVRELVLLGEAREMIKSEVMESGFRNIHEVEDFPAAVYKAHQLARPGDVVLLSPACASWDMFPSYEHRGDQFCQIIDSIIKQQS
ncbi:MAG TPA: UDP-N-acetylmuramoyl-L-alanine--D-glutamate ligase [Syntrophomonas sp.]|nr:UDP-N-acetylmuramoyl-L-alanine--D-glutamate ligase [Syntrophomonas sp.]